MHAYGGRARHSLVCFAALLGLLTKPGCRPALQEGYFSCAEDNACPKGWYCHQNDGACYSQPEKQTATGGNGSTNRPTALGGNGGLGASELSPCDSNDECDGEHCATGIDPLASSGLCSRACASQADCNDSPETTACYAGHCLPYCDTENDCPGDTRCHETHQMLLASDAPRPPKGTKLRLCYASTYHEDGVPSACGPDFETCALPFKCWQAAAPSQQGPSSTTPAKGPGMCSTTCSSDDDCLPQRCVEVFEGQQRICMTPCDGHECTTDLSCILLGSANYCAPAQWEGGELPLSLQTGPEMMQR